MQSFSRILMMFVLGLSAGLVHAATYPDKNIEMVVAGAAGGGLDLTGRALDAALHEAKLFKHTFDIKNMGGAGGNIAKTYVNQKKGDPHFIYIESNRIYVNKIVGTTALAITAATR